jgi:hypothetical protein
MSAVSSLAMASAIAYPLALPLAAKSALRRRRREPEVKGPNAPAQQRSLSKD